MARMRWCGLSGAARRAREGRPLGFLLFVSLAGIAAHSKGYVAGGQTHSTPPVVLPRCYAEKIRPTFPSG